MVSLEAEAHETLTYAAVTSAEVGEVGTAKRAEEHAAPPSPGDATPGGPAGESAKSEPDRPARHWWRTPLTGRWADLAAATTYLLGALYLYGHWWSHIGPRYLANSLQDQTMYEWFFMYVARSVTHLQNPLYTHLQNAPDGVNMMANTPMLGLSVPLTPVTLLFGPTVSYAIVLIVGMAATGTAWYWLFSRHLVGSRLAAWFGAGICTFAPPMISHANGHANWVAHFLIPIIAWRVIKLREPGHVVRNGVILGLLLTYQVFLGEEVLFISSLAIASFVVLYAAQRWRETRAAIRPFLAGAAVAGLVAAVLLAYPLWMQMLGPRHYNGLPSVRNMNNDLRSFFAYGTQTVAGNAKLASKLAVNTTEENSFFGWSALLLAGLITIWMWRSVVARTAAIMIIGFGALSLGFNITWHRVKPGIPGPWRLFDQLPLFDSILPSRLSLVGVPCLGLLIALAVDRLIRERERPPTVRYAIAGVIILALLPIVPKPLPVRDRPPVPKFFADGTWRQYVRPGRSVVAVPLPDAISALPLDWQVAARGDFNLAEGYFVGPHGADRHGAHGADRRPTSQLLADYQYDGKRATITQTQRDQAVRDLRFWQADIVVLQPERAKVAPLVVDLLGPGKFIDGVWIWDVRSITS
jgi:hypothetical protein